MKTITDPIAQQEIFKRMDSLRADTPRLWGTMTAAQMLLHCRRQIGLGTGEVTSKPMFPKAVQWLAKQSFGFSLPWKRNLPTAPEMTAMDDGLDFSHELEMLRSAISAFVQLPDDAALSGHPIFGQMDKQEWGLIIHKHLDHHLRQFGV